MTAPREIEAASRENLLLRVRNIEAMLKHAERYETVGNEAQAQWWLKQALERYETLPPFLQKRVQW